MCHKMCHKSTNYSNSFDFRQIKKCLYVDYFEVTNTSALSPAKLIVIVTLRNDYGVLTTCLIIMNDDSGATCCSSRRVRRLSGSVIAEGHD